MGASSGRVLIISSPTLNSTLAIGENPTPINSGFPCQNQGRSEAGPTSLEPVAMPSFELKCSVKFTYVVAYNPLV